MTWHFFYLTVALLAFTYHFFYLTKKLLEQKQVVHGPVFLNTLMSQLRLSCRSADLTRATTTGSKRCSAADLWIGTARSCHTWTPPVALVACTLAHSIQTVCEPALNTRGEIPNLPERHWWDSRQQFVTFRPAVIYNEYLRYSTAVYQVQRASFLARWSYSLEFVTS